MVKLISRGLSIVLIPALVLNSAGAGSFPPVQMPGPVSGEAYALLITQAITSPAEAPLQSIAGHVREDVSASAQQVYPRGQVPAQNLMALREKAAISLAHGLRELLFEVKFDFVNGGSRHATLGGSYENYPFPMDSELTNIKTIREFMGVLAGKENEYGKVSERSRLAMEFFMFGTSLTSKQMRLLFSGYRRLIAAGLAMELFREEPNGTFRMNGLSLVSLEINHEVIFAFADTPPDFETAIAPQRVYIGPDSYELAHRIAAQPVRGGISAEVGSGTGFQEIIALVTHPELSGAVGFEIDPRAVSVSIFNAALNGLEKRMTITESIPAFYEAIGGRNVALVPMNPPFMSVPGKIPIDAEDIPFWSQHTEIYRDEHDAPGIDLRALFGRAGWGGVDGLAVTKEFVEILLPVLGREAVMVIYSAFAGIADEPTLIRKLVRSLGADTFDFEPLTGRPSLLEDGSLILSQHQFTAELSAMSMVIALRQQHLDWQTSAIPQTDEMLMRLQKRIMEAYAAEGIQTFVTGFVLIDGWRAPDASLPPKDLQMPLDLVENMKGELPGSAARALDPRRIQSWWDLFLKKGLFGLEAEWRAYFEESGHLISPEKVIPAWRTLFRNA